MSRCKGRFDRKTQRKKRTGSVRENTTNHPVHTSPHSSPPRVSYWLYRAGSFTAGQSDSRRGKLTRGFVILRWCRGLLAPGSPLQAIEERDKSTRNLRLYLACGVIKLVMSDEQCVEDVRRERHAEKLRRAYEALGREQNGIFESLAEYTHEVQAEVRALQIARDRLYVEQLPSNAPSAPLRVGRPLFLGDRWLSFDAAAAGVVVCGVLGLLLGWRWYQGTLFWGGLRNKDKNRRNLHEE